MATTYRVLTWVDGVAHYLRPRAVEKLNAETMKGEWHEWTTSPGEAAEYTYRIDADAAAQQSDDISGELPEVEEME